jgi:hypothetical protein
MRATPTSAQQRRHPLGKAAPRSEHRWFEDRRPCTLPVFVADATGRLMPLRFVPSEMGA